MTEEVSVFQATVWFFITAIGILIYFGRREGWLNLKGLIFGYLLVYFMALCNLGLGEKGIYIALSGTPLSTLIIGWVIVKIFGRLD